MQRPNVIHVPIRPTAGSAHSKSSRASSAPWSRGRSCLRNSLSGPCGRVDPHERLRDDDRRDRLRHEQHRAEEQEAPHAEARQERRQEQPDHDREDRVVQDQLDRVPERLVDLGRVPQLAIVAEADPLLRREPVPVVERQPHRLQQREEREDQVEREPRQDVQVRDVAGLARRPPVALPSGGRRAPGSLPGALGGLGASRSGEALLT